MRALKTTDVTAAIEEKISSIASPKFRNEGRVAAFADGVAVVLGMSDVMYGELIEFENGTRGMALNLRLDSTDVIVTGGAASLKEGLLAKTTGRVFEVPVGEALLGRVVDALGEPLDGLGAIDAKAKLPVERVAPGVITRQSVHRPMQTGLKPVDIMIPVGRGQRELIIGDRQTGKTAIAIDTILNQKGKGVKCIYVAIGQKQSSVANLVRILREHGAMEYTTVVLAGASDPAALQYISAYAGCAMGEYYRDKGEDALIVYDDLSKHAVAYRQISLLLRRPPGREAYPGDVFYLHSRLLERAACVNEEYVSQMTGGKVKREGSLTALPIVETQGGDISSFVPTNVISITDGQIFLESDLFNAGLRPAVNVGLSVSRVGGSAQFGIVKKLGSDVRVSLAQYRELAAFSQFASDLDPVTRRQLERGERVMQLMRQKQYAPRSTAELVVTLVLSSHASLLEVPVAEVFEFEEELIRYFNTDHANLMKEINENPDFSKERVDAVKAAIDAFTAQTARAGA